MKTARITPWVVGALMLSLIIMAAAWFLAISPALDDAATARKDTEDQSARNDQLVIQNARLKKQFEDIESYRAELAEYQKGIPRELLQSDLTRQFDALSVASGAFIVDIEFEPSTLLLTDASGISSLDAAQLAAAAPKDDEAASDDDATAPEVEPPLLAVPEPVSPLPAPDGLYAVPVKLTLLGSPDAVATYLDSLQTGSDRHFFVIDVDIKGQDEAEASGGKPAIQQGDAEMVINGYVYVLNPDLAPEDPDAEGAEVTGSEEGPAAEGESAN